MVLDKIRSFFVNGLAIDLGTVNTLIYLKRHGIVLNEPSMIAVNRFSGEIVAVGHEAMTIMGREPREIVVHRPIENGVVADYNMTEKILRAFLRRARQRHSVPWRFTHMVVGSPNSATHLERRGIQEAVIQAGASRVSMVDEGVAAAIGADVLFQDERARLLVDVGGGTTNISIVSSAGTISSHSLDIAGLAMDRAIREYVRQEYMVLLGEQTAERLKIQLGSALPGVEDRSLSVVGKNTVDGSPQELALDSDEIVQALDRPIRTIIESIQLIITEAPPEIAADLFSTGIVLAGGGSLLPDLDRRIADEIDLTVVRAERPLETVALGTGYLLDHPSLLERFRINNAIPSWEFETDVDYALEA